jgi:hypothetical protein
MKSSIWTFAVVFIISTLALPAATVKARDADEKPLTFTAAQTDKQKRSNACRVRYRDCLKLNQIPSFECQFVYEDCTRKIY